MRKRIQHLGILITLCTLNLTAQIVCKPDYLVKNGNNSLNIDFDGDSNPELNVASMQAGPVSDVKLTGFNYSVMINSAGQAQALSQNTPIGPSSAIWGGGVYAYMAFFWSGPGSGPWSGVSNRYLGVAFLSGSNVHYGWARFSFSGTTNTYTYSGCAFNTVPGQLILAGQSCGSIAMPDFDLPAAACTGNTVMLFPQNGTIAATGYTWSCPGAVLAAANSSATLLTYTAAGAYTVLLTVSGTGGPGIASHTVLVNGTVPSLSVNPVSTIVCIGSSATLTALGNAATYSWSPPLQVWLSAGNVAEVYVGSSTQVFTVTGTLNGCSSIATATVIPDHPVFLLSYSGQPSFCAQPHNGSSISKSVNLWVYGQSNYTTTVNAPPNVTAVFNNQMLTASSAPPYNNIAETVTVLITASNGNCPSSSVPFEFTVHANPTFSFSPTATTVCQGAKVTFTGTGNFSSWTSGIPASLQGASGNNLSAKAVSTTTYSGYTTASNGCRSASHIASVTVIPGPTLSVSGVTLCTGEEGIISATGAHTYTWTDPGGFTLNTPAVQIPAQHQSATLSYSISATGSTTCTTSSVVTVKIADCTSTLQNKNPENIRVTNPVTDLISIYHTHDVSGVALFDTNGKTIAYAPVSRDNRLDIPVHDLPRGLYLLTLTHSGKVRSIRIIMQ